MDTSAVELACNFADDQLGQLAYVPRVGWYVIGWPNGDTLPAWVRGDVEAFRRCSRFIGDQATQDPVIVQAVLAYATYLLTVNRKAVA